MLEGPPSCVVHACIVLAACRRAIFEQRGAHALHRRLASTSHDAVLRLWDLSALHDEDGAEEEVEAEEETAAAEAVSVCSSSVCFAFVN